jgi:hypothetical protein
MNCSKKVLKPVMALLFSLALSGQVNWAQAAESDTALIEQLTGAKGQWNEKACSKSVSRAQILMSPSRVCA